MRVLAICSFLDEERLLPAFLESMAAQSRRPDRLVLVDDGSTDGSTAIARAFAEEHAFAVCLRRPPRPRERDRLARANELRAFHWGLAQAGEPYDAVAKLDADVRLAPETFAHLLACLEREPELGLVGPYLSEEGPSGLWRESGDPRHVRGALKLYRRACFEQIAPVDEILGWDTADEIAARMHGWRVRSEAIPGGDPIHLRPVATEDGRLRGYRRIGACAWGFGAHPLHVLLGGVRRLGRRPYLLGGLSYLAGWAGAGLRRAPRAPADVRAFGRAEQTARIRGLLSRGGR